MCAQVQANSQITTEGAVSRPIPSVVIVGNRDSSFGKEAWRRIKEAYAEQSINFGKLPSTDFEDPASIVVEKNRPRSEGPTLYPFFLDDKGQTQSINFQNSLQRD
jgi:hypothetical protein